MTASRAVHQPWMQDDDSACGRSTMFYFPPSSPRPQQPQHTPQLDNAPPTHAPRRTPHVLPHLHHNTLLQVWDGYNVQGRLGCLTLSPALILSLSPATHAHLLFNCSRAGHPHPSTSSPALGYNTTYTPPPCAVLTHFPAACTLGTLAALLAFERAAVVQNQGSPGRATDKALLGSIYAVVWCIEGPSYLWWSHHESQARSVYGGSSYRGSNNMMRSCKKHPTLLLLIALSYLPGYVVTLLQAGLCSWVDIGTWMARALVYGTVLRVLRAGVAECLQGPYQ
ncbi:hypothetical protein K438DRAFT_2001209 [Mycena galopus ATCC 62051]|nr:hypothetical protein K438DRAFT_2001209 [Mycena galopus ATCC 62051]